MAASSSSSSPPQAWTFRARGSPRSVLTLNPLPDVVPALPPLPIPKNSSAEEEWLLLRTRHAALNPGGLYMMGLIPAWVRSAVAVPECELSATIEDVWTPSSSSLSTSSTTATPPKFRKGQRVAAFIPGSYGIPNGAGALTSRLALPARFCIPVPDAVADDADAAGLVLAACTARQLLDLSGVGPGCARVLVNGASGGIGTMAIQLARHLAGPGGFVVGVCSGRNADLVRGLGADEVVDYVPHGDAGALAAYLAERYGPQPFGAVVDTVGKQSLYKGCAGFLAEGGIYAATKVETAGFGIRAFLPAVITMKANEVWPLSRWLGGTGREWRSAAMLDPSRELREEVMDLLGRQVIKVVVDSVWNVQDVLKGYEILESGRARGKILVSF